MGAGIRLCADRGIQCLQTAAEDHTECYHAEALRVGDLA